VPVPGPPPARCVGLGTCIEHRAPIPVLEYDCLGTVLSALPDRLEMPSMSRARFRSIGVILSVALFGAAGCGRPLALSKPDGGAAVAHDGGTAPGDAGTSSADAARDAAIAVDITTAIDAPMATTDVADARLDASDAPSALAPNQYRVIALAVGRNQRCAILDDHRLKCWGDNEFGQLGLGDTKNRGADATTMGDNLPAVDLGTGRTATAIAAGMYTTCAILDNDTLKCWGAFAPNPPKGLNENIGVAPEEMGDNLKPIELGVGRKPVAVAVGWSETCVALDDGSFVCFGGSITPVAAAADGARVVQLARDEGTLGVFDDGSVRRISLNSPSGPTPVDFGGRQATFAAGVENQGSVGLGDCVILRAGGTACNWVSEPSAVGPTTASVVTIALTEYAHACGLDALGAVTCWNLPEQREWRGADGAYHIPLGQPATVIGAGDNSGCALLADGTVKCWEIDGSFLATLGGSVATATEISAVDLGTRPAP
jgi:hypothetical protein